MDFDICSLDLPNIVIYVLLMWVDFCLVLCKSAGAGLVNWWDCSSCLVAMCMSCMEEWDVFRGLQDCSDLSGWLYFMYGKNEIYLEDCNTAVTCVDGCILCMERMRFI